MAKFYGPIGFAETEEIRPGVFQEVIEEHNYRGDVIRDTRQHEGSENLNDNVNISNIITIVADSYAYQKVFAIRYIKWMGVRWKVKDVTVERPRLRITVGGVYNGSEATTSS